MDFKDIGGSVTNNITSTNYTFHNTITYNDSFNGDRINSGGNGVANGVTVLVALLVVGGVGYLLLQNAGLIALLAGGTYAAYRLDKAVFKDGSQAQPVKYLEVKQ